MLLELMAGKSSVSHGIIHDATPFKFSEENTASDYHSQMLAKGEAKSGDRNYEKIVFKISHILYTAHPLESNATIIIYFI